MPVCGVAVCPFSRQGKSETQMPLKQGSNASVMKLPFQTQDKPALGTAGLNIFLGGRNAHQVELSGSLNRNSILLAIPNLRLAPIARLPPEGS